VPAAIRIPKQERAQRTRAKLLEAAQRELSEKGFGGATARSIAKRAGAATGSFYQYFKDKDAVLRELGQARFDRIATLAMNLLRADGEVTDVHQEARVRMRSVVEAVMAYHREDPGLHAVLTERRVHDPELDRATQKGERALLEGVAAMIARWGHQGDHEATAFVLFGMVEGAVHAHCLGHALVSDERFVTALVNALVASALPKS
ncbi:MAG: TetR/AcrR family transcriptional regulator, partial [Myxococcota bacterium]